MPHLSPFPQTQSTPGECSLFKFDTYADAILRTLYSFKAPPPPMRFHARRHNRHSYPQSTTVSQSVVNEVSGIKTCIHIYKFVYVLFIFSLLFSSGKLMGGVPSYFYL